MARTLSLHPLTAIDASPVELIKIAGRLDVPLVCLFTHVPDSARHLYPRVTAADVPQVREALGAAGVALCNLEVFPLDRDGGIDHLHAGLEIGAAIGASKATAHIHDIASEQQAIDRFARFAEAAAGYGIIAGLEFHNFSAVHDVGAAERIVRGAARGSLVLDILHFVRGGGSPADAARVADLVGYLQLSDGPLDIPPEGRWREAISERQLPGEGALPLGALIRSMPAAIHEVEVPQSLARKSGIDAYKRCRGAIAAARRMLKTLDEETDA